MKGIISKIVKLAQRHIQFITPKEKIVFLHPGKQIQTAYQHEDQTIEDLGVLGELHPEIAQWILNTQFIFLNLIGQA